MTEWHHDAACAGDPTEIWFETGHERLALSICSACPVRSECLAAAFDEERGMGAHARHGIRGGLTSIERTNAGTKPSRTVVDDPVFAHGSRSLYRKGCRCAACTEAQAAYQRDWEQRRRKRTAPRRQSTAEHGTRARYTSGCRCDDCRAANAAYNRHLRNGGGLGV